MTTHPAFLDLADPGFSTRSGAVIAARSDGWYARTPFGLAILRHREVGELLRDRRLRQGSHAWPATNDLRGSFAAFWLRSVISQEGPAHQATRQLALSALSADFVATLGPAFDDIATTLSQRVTGPEGCEFVNDFSEPFAGQAIAALLGLPREQAGEIGADAASLGLAMAVTCKANEARFNAACDRLTDLAGMLLEQARRERNPARFVDRLVIGNDRAGLSEQALLDLVVISIFGGVDTTRAQLAFAMALFADHPDQWQHLRAEPGLIPQAIEEVIRARPTTTWSTREATQDFTYLGVAIRAGEILHLLVHASGTDPQAVGQWQFDITARRKAHFGFGGGAHHCLGQLVARTDMAAALRALAAKVARVEYAGTPRWLPDSGNTSPAHLPLRLVAAL